MVTFRFWGIVMTFDENQMIWLPDAGVHPGLALGRNSKIAPKPT